MFKLYYTPKALEDIGRINDFLTSEYGLQIARACTEKLVHIFGNDAESDLE